MHPPHAAPPPRPDAFLHAVPVAATGEVVRVLVRPPGHAPPFRIAKRFPGRRLYGGRSDGGAGRALYALRKLFLVLEGNSV